ncbi:MAG: glycosyltransferase family 2 protein [Treponema sp.]|nr:glycosyltransferase family 2 protein [Treponema sp.]
MIFSLILPTINRSTELDFFLQSLNTQTYSQFELIIIDQNSEYFIENLCKKYKFNIKIIKNNTKGLSLNRNIGLKYATGDIIAFPDDDCEYDPQTLEKVNIFFIKNPEYNFYTCNTKEKHTEQSVFSGLSKNTQISKYNFMRTGVSITIFIKSKALHQFKFDEQLGAGTAFGSGEESDLLLYLIKNNNKGFYFSHDFIYHPNTKNTVQRSFLYGKGFGALFKKGVFTYNFYSLLLIYFLYICKNIINIFYKKDKYNQITKLKGRLIGFFQYQINR